MIVCYNKYTMKKTMPLTHHIIIFDTEYTAWPGSMKRNYNLPNEHRELVQIAALRLDTISWRVLSVFSVYIKPAINPILSPYFIRLTGITQCTVDQHGLPFKQALRLFTKFVGDTSCYSFGFDARVLRKNCRLLSIPYPLAPRQCHDIRRYFISYGIPAKKYTSGTIVKAFGRTKSRQAHNALNDCRTIVDGLKLLNKMKSDEKINI